MNVQTLQRTPAAIAGTTECCLCNARIAPGSELRLVAHARATSGLQSAICSRCSNVLGRVADIIGPELTLLIQQHPQHVDTLIGGPSARTACARTHADPP
jgi:hypothetical protein